VRAVRRIELESWEGARVRRERVRSTTPRALRQALDRLDGRRIDSLWVSVADVGALTVGGGPTAFIVLSFPADGSSSHVRVGVDDGRTVKVKTGGQEGLYPRAMVLTAAEAFDVAERFLASGAYDANLDWVEDCPPE
jgi:hypothetical protein